jgi:hypothetical protein
VGISPEDTLFTDLLQELLRNQYAGMNAAQRVGLEEALDRLGTTYEDAAGKRDKDDRYKKICKKISAGMPGVTTGALSAFTAFSKSDYMAGSAAIMDICAEIGPMIGSVSSAAGPYGAAFGALFSVVGLLLTFFGPKQPTMEEQISNMLLSHEAKAKVRTALSIGDSIDLYADHLGAASEALPEILALPLLNEDDAEDFDERCRALNIGIVQNQSRLDMTALENWGVLRWLKDTNVQQLDEWPQVLDAFCQSYNKLFASRVHFACTIDRDRVRALLREVRKTNNNSPLPEGTRTALYETLMNLLGLTRAYSDDWRSYNKKVGELTADIDQAARYRGLFLIIGRGYGHGYLYGSSGKKDIVDSNNWLNLWSGMDARTSGHGYISRMATTICAEAASSSIPSYHCFLLRTKSGEDEIEYRKVLASNPPTSTHLSTFSPQGLPLFRGRSIKDLWAVPGAGSVPGRPSETWLFVAAGSSISQLVLNDEGVLSQGYTPSTDAGSPLLTVRSVYAEPVPGDPDGDIGPAIPGMDPWSHGKAGALVHYGGLANSTDVWVSRHIGGPLNPQRGYIPTPLAQYTGIAVDPHFLWVFGPSGFAWTTHASAIRHIKDRSAPRWFGHYPNKVLYRGLVTSESMPVAPRDGEPALQGLSDFAPCGDGTLVASMFTRSYENGRRTGDDGPYIYTADYQIDIVAGTFQIGQWTKLTGEAEQVQKQPIYCWPVFESLKAKLVADGRRT